MRFLFSLLTLGVFPILFQGLGFAEKELPYLLWVVTLPYWIHTVRSQFLSGVKITFFTITILFVLNPVDGCRYLSQILLPGWLAGMAFQKKNLSLIDSFYLAGFALLLTTVVGVLWGYGENLREVVLPAGYPAGFLREITHRWENWVNSLHLPEIPSFSTWIGQYEPFLWSILLLISMGVGIGSILLWGKRGVERQERFIPSHLPEILSLTLLFGFSVSLIPAKLFGDAGTFLLLSSAGVLAFLAIAGLLGTFQKIPGGKFLFPLTGFLLLREPFLLSLLPFLGFGTMWKQWKMIP
jgi:hypothetical protein